VCWVVFLLWGWWGVVGLVVGCAAGGGCVWGGGGGGGGAVWGGEGGRGRRDVSAVAIVGSLGERVVCARVCLRVQLSCGRGGVRIAGVRGGRGVEETGKL